MLCKRLLLAACVIALSGIAALFPGARAAGDELVFADFSGAFADGTFLAEDAQPFVTNTSYRSHNLSVAITSGRAEDSTYYVADIYVRTAAYLKRVFSSGKWRGDTQTVGAMAEAAGAVVAMSGDYAASFSKGYVIQNGVAAMAINNSLRDVCLLYTDGVMETYLKNTLNFKAAQARGIWQSFLFGPCLLSGGQPIIKNFNSNVFPANPRAAIGYFEPGHYCLVLVDGRTSQDRGMTLRQLSALMASLGCVSAYNLDGGQSAALWFGGRIVNSPYRGGRKVADIVYAGE
jgi:exopolysaccharide biosynthesis protein